MKPARALLFVALTLSLSSGQTLAQSARQLTRKIVPQPAQPAQPAPATVRPQPGPAPAPAPAAPIDPAKAAAEKAEQDKRVVEFQKKRAEQGSASAQYDLGLRYLEGNGVAADEATARKWLTEAGNNGNKAAARKLKELNDTKK
jgi:TPR repeat protein